MTGMAGHDPGISGHVRPESLVTLLRNTHLLVIFAIVGFVSMVASLSGQAVQALQKAAKD